MIQTEEALSHSKREILKGFKDLNFYVKKIAIICSLKIYYQDKDFFDEQRIIEQLYNFLRDTNREVVIAAINVLNEIMIQEGGIVTNTKIIYYLLNRFNEFSPNEKCILLKIIQRFEPENKDQMFDIMSMLEESLATDNLALVLQILQIFLKYTERYQST